MPLPWRQAYTVRLTGSSLCLSELLSPAAWRSGPDGSSVVAEPEASRHPVSMHLICIRENCIRNMGLPSSTSFPGARSLDAATSPENSHFSYSFS